MCALIDHVLSAHARNDNLVKKVVTVTFLLLLKSSQFVHSSRCDVTVSPPWPNNTNIPYGSSVSIFCSTVGYMHPFFFVKLPNRQHSTQFSQELESLFNGEGFYLGERNSDSIQLYINSTQEKNGTIIKCADVRGLGSTTDTSETVLITYVPTPLVIEFNSRNTSLVHNSAYISWSPNFHTIDVIYSLIIRRESTPFPHSFTLLNEPYHVFTAPEGAPPCEVYNFSVTTTYVGATYTGAGCSVPNPVLSRMLPSLPNIEELNSSLTYSPVLIHDDFKLNVSFKSGISCEDYPVLNYTLEIKSSSPSEIVTHSIAPNQFNLIGNLSANREYLFKVVIVNAIGNVSTNVRQFNTADVQIVTAIFDAKSNVFIVQCDFVPGSDAQGCMVVLVGESDNTTVNLTRFDTVAEEFINVTCPPKNYIRVIGYDIESDNKSFGPLAVPGRLLINDSVLCLLNSHKIESSLSVATILAITIPTTFIIIISIIIIIIVLLVKRTRVPKPSVQSKLGTLKLQPPSQPQQDKERFETEEPQQIIPLYDFPKKSKVADKGAVGDTHHSTSECDQNDNVIITENITTYAEKDLEHFYFTLENAKKPEVIPPDPDAPELPPPFKPETSPPPVYQDILDLRGNKGNTTLQNEYSTVST